MALCVTIHAMGLTAAVHWMRRWPPTIAERFWPSTWMLICVAGWAVLVHLLQIVIWGFFYAWSHGMPDLPSAFYFSAVTYTTTGYDDLVLPKEWRLVGGVEALTGILMCGLSAGLFFCCLLQGLWPKPVTPPGAIGPKRLAYERGPVNHRLLRKSFKQSPPISRLGHRRYHFSFNP
jgi:hypothetical protein